MKIITLLADDNILSNEVKCVALLTILAGRLLHMAEVGEMGKDTGQEARLIVQTALHFLMPTNALEVSEAALDIVRSLPVHTTDEIMFVLEQAENTPKHDLQDAYVYALRYSAPYDEVAWDALKKGESSQVHSIREAVGEVLRRKGSGLLHL